MTANREAETLDFLRRLGEAHRGRARARGRRVNFFAGTWTGPGGGFAGAKLDRTSEEWNPGTVGPNRAHQMDARILRERARDLVQNNPHAGSAVASYIANVIERGITPKPRFDDAGRRKLWQRAWERWGGVTPCCDSEADISGHDTIYDLEALWLLEVIVGGGCLMHFVELPRSRGRSLPLSIELIPEERLTDERDNFAYPLPKARKTNNPIVRGVEIAPATGRPVAYWVKPSMPNDSLPEELEPVRLPAEQCSYAFFRRRAGQYRGHTLLHAVIVYLWRLGYYLDAELLASQMKANWGFMVGTDGDSGLEFPDLADSDTENAATDAYGNKLEKLEPGMIWRGRPGDTIHAVGPNVPGGDSLPWIQLIEQSIAMGMDLSMIELTRDFSRVNFSSARAAANSDRKRFRRMQSFTVTKFCNPVWRRFAATAARVGLDGFPSQSEFLANLDELLDVSWRAPGWESVNPLDDAKADEIRVKMRTKTRERIIADGGGDWEDDFEQHDREEQRLEELGLGTADEAALAAASAGESTPDESDSGGDE